MTIKASIIGIVDQAQKADLFWKSQPEVTYLFTIDFTDAGYFPVLLL